MSAEVWATPADLAARYQISVDAVRARVNRQTDPWPHARIGRMIRFSPEHQDTIARLIAGERGPVRRASRIQAAFDALRAS